MSLPEIPALDRDIREARKNAKGTRPVKVANCSGYAGDPSWQMLRQATLGDVDFITGDYLAEMNLAENAEAYKSGRHDGFVETAWEGLKESIDVIASRGIKVVINGGGLNPAGLAEKVSMLARDRGLELKVAFVSGDDLLPVLQHKVPPHIDSDNPNVKLPRAVLDPITNGSTSIVSANAYLGARAIVQGLQLGADIIICGRVADASPVIGAAWYWHCWNDTDYNELAGALISGHLIECSAYVTGGNFCGFTEYDQEIFLDPGFPIAEIERDGSCVITKHEATGGLINEDTVRCQFLYELQGSLYLNSDVKACLNNVTIKSVGKDRVRVTGISGKPPPPTTKVSIFYHGGYQSQILLNATGYETTQKWALFEAQLRRKLKLSGADMGLTILDFQIVGTSEPNPKSQLKGTTYCRVFAEALTQQPLVSLLHDLKEISLQHFSGLHSALDRRTAIPKSFLTMYPAIYPQDEIQESITLLNTGEAGLLEAKTTDVGPPPAYEPLERRENSETTLNGRDLRSFGPTKPTQLGALVLGRSGDKGANLNVGFFVRTGREWEWLRVFLSSKRMIQLLGEDWNGEEYFIERVEFPNIFAVHFVIYGILGRGVSGSNRLDALGKGFADYIRAKIVDVPSEFL